MERLIETPFYRAISSRNCKSNIQELYNSFAHQVFQNCNNTTQSYRELLFMLNYTQIELTSLSDMINSNEEGKKCNNDYLYQ